ncbi:MAG: hypothetical protein COU47_02950 [Candidatus Niyogibacteria bacterium CG10_big_fil_rev_8_21_14_0_10_46_36]|uniref:Transglycosylase SLT domain-containing protein n=1 Tax=Candidatus Niyogibacteria bacterium CG10_big_fil_rev_8_21_14_0_10_46_36 TaxID=1974726 RepID=A0A2H0TD76_9BACT|nr:MAG: hypothetical protein COU47_02950 [Candidatus Niyogibacteria bacterium CG10_big_fil_rev_8_21_14_0_10_46_36]
MGNKFHYLFILGGVVVLVPFFLSAQTVNPALVGERRAELEAELAELETQIEGFRGVISEKQKERTSLERDVAILDAQIEKSRLEIRARNLTISKLTESIGEKSTLITSLDQKIDSEKESLSELLRKVYELDQTSLVELMLSYETLSDFFVDFDNFDTVQVALQFSFGEIRRTQATAGEERTSLEERKTEEVQLRALQELERQRIEQQEKEKQNLLNITKGVEAEYQKILAGREKDAAKIRSELFLLQGSAAIPFEKAVEYANAAFQLTGVRPAFILGVVAQESNLGENVGQCLLTNQPSKGDGKGINTGRIFSGVMKPSRDVDVFVQITQELGLDPYSMVVSCPPGYGYGGAMGPAQFIPSTWILYKDKIAQLTGQNPPNPWDPRTAFIASAVLLKENGAAAGTYQAERLAALRYFAGWVNANKASYAFYGDDVMALATKYQNQIDIISR